MSVIFNPNYISKQCSCGRRVNKTELRMSNGTEVCHTRIENKSK